MLSEIRQPNPPFLYLNPLFKNPGDAPGQPPHRVVKVADFCTVYLLIISVMWFQPLLVSHTYCGTVLLTYISWSIDFVSLEFQYIPLWHLHSSMAFASASMKPLNI